MLNKEWRVFAVLTAALLCHFVAQGSFLPATTSQHIEQSGAVFLGTVERVEAFEEDGNIWTRATVSVRETFKGSLPQKIHFVSKGGLMPDKGERNCSSPDIHTGEERLFFLSRGKSGRLALTRGGESAIKMASSTGQKLVGEMRARVVSGLLPGEDFAADSAGEDTVAGPETDNPPYQTVVGNLMSAARFLQPDAGGKIPYIIDRDFLPASITTSQAVWAVTRALDAWAGVSSVRFVFAGYQSFGRPASQVEASDGVLRIQLHDAYGALTGTGELGEGGRAWMIQNSPSGWTSGGNVAGIDFHQVTRGYVTLRHTAAAMGKLLTFTEVLTHEIGHALGLGHSSQNYPEPDNLLSQSVMYWLVHDDERGATLNSWDIDVCRQLHPLNTPPVCFSRYMDIVTSPLISLNIPGVNTVQMPGYDLNGAGLTFQISNASTRNGVFSLSNGAVTYTPAAYYSDSPRYHPSTGSSYDDAFIRCSDGVNASPWTRVAVVSFNQDSYNEGLPDWWRTSWFGSPNPNSGANHKAGEDADGDGYTNLQEWWMSSDPTDPASNLRITGITATNLHFEAHGYDVYEIFRSSDLSTWTREPGAVAPQDFVGVFKIDPTVAPRSFFKIRRVP